MLPRAILIDIDGTLLPQSLEQRFLAYLLQTGYTTWGAVVHRTLRMARQWPLLRWHRIKLMYLQNAEERDVAQWARQCWASGIKPALFPGVDELFEFCRAQGMHIVLISGTFRALAEPLMQEFGVKDILCAEPEIRGGRYTGALIAPHPRGKRKVAVAELWLRERNIPWQQVAALADNRADRFLLEKAAYPIVMRPGKTMRRYSQSHGWPVVKDLAGVQRRLAELES